MYPFTGLLLGQLAPVRIVYTLFEFRFGRSIGHYIEIAFQLNGEATLTLNSRIHSPWCLPVVLVARTPNFPIIILAQFINRFISTRSRRDRQFFGHF